MIDALVIGGNHNGLTIAIMLAKIGLNVHIIEAGKIRFEKPSGSAARLMAIAAESREILKQFIDFDFTTSCSAIRKILVTDQSSKHELTFDPSNIEMTDFGMMIDEFDLTKILYNQARSNPKISFTLEKRVVNLVDHETTTEVTMDDGTSAKAQLIVACDGKHSKIRSMLGIETFDHNYNQSAIVFDIEHQVAHDGLAVEKFLPSGPFAILPQYNPYVSSIVWTVEKTHRNSILALHDNELLELVQARTPEHYGRVKIISQIAAFDLTKTIAKDYYHNHTVLLGDSLHSIHPLAGQGYNLSLRDAQRLYELIDERWNLGLPISGHSIFEQYKKDRSSDNALMAEATNIINLIFSNEILPLRIARGIGLSAIDRFPALKQTFMRYACGL